MSTHLLAALRGKSLTLLVCLVFGDPSEGVAERKHLGTFGGNGLLTLNLDFDNLTSIVGAASADGTLFIRLTSTLGSTTTTLFNNFFTVGSDPTLIFPALGDFHTLAFFLFSEAGTTGAGQAGQNFSQLVFSGTIDSTQIPEPGTMGLACLALLCLSATPRRRPSR